MSGKKTFGWTCLSLLLLCAAGHYAYFGTCRYVAELGLTDSLEHAEKLWSEGRYKDAQDYIEFYTDLPGVSRAEADRLAPIREKVVAKRESLLYRAEELGKGFFLGESDESYGQMAGLASEFLVVGDVRDLATAGYRFANDEEVDTFRTSIAALGLALTVASVGPQAAVTVPAKTGVAALKVAKRVRKLSESLQKNILSILARAGKEQNVTMVVDELVEPLAVLGRYGERRGFGNALEVVAHTDALPDVVRTVKVAEQYADKAGAVFRFAGPDVVRVTELVGHVSVLRVAKYGPEAVSALKRMPIEKLLGDIGRYLRILSEPFLQLLSWGLYVVEVGLGFFGLLFLRLGRRAVGRMMR